jgi:uncharacterized protein (DUF433 family)
MKYFIKTDPKIMGGLPCVTGTRIPVSQILFLLKQGYSFKEIQKDYSWVSLATLEGVMQEVAQKFGSTSYDTQAAQI